MNRLDSRAYVKSLYHLTDRAFDYRRPLSSGDWAGWQAEFRSRLRGLLGLSRMEETLADFPLSPRRAESRDFPGYTREKWYIASEPGIEIPFYLLLPKRADAAAAAPLPLVLAPHGHTRRGKEVYAGNFEGEPADERHEDIALQAVAQGYAAIAPDVRGFGEMAREEEAAAGKVSSCEELQRRALMFGRTLIGERVWDIGRLLDFAAGRAGIDANRAVVTGNSGGGTASLFAAACDGRISIAVPGSYFCTYEASILGVHHCICNVVPGLLSLGEMHDVAGLIAPRPLLLVNGAQDPIYPIAGARAAFGHLQQIYASMGAPDRCELYVGEGGHRYYPERVWPFVRAFLDRNAQT